MITFGAAKVSAQSTNTNTVTFTTNVVQQVNITITGFEQAGGSNSTSVTPVHIATKDIIRDLGTASGSSFGQRAKLVAVTPVGGGTTSFMVESGPSGTNGAVDVSSFVSATTVGTPVLKAKTNAKGKTTGTMYSIDSFTYGATDTNGNPTTGITFTLQGFTTTQLANGAFNSSVNGTGTSGADPIVVHGTISGGPGKFQEVSSQ
jgi:hypothetical protein